MLFRSLAVWSLLLLLAVVNGGIRQKWLVARAGERRAYSVSTVTLCIAILITTLLTIDWLNPASFSQALFIGAVWAALTLGFEIVGGHFLFHEPWAELIEDYDIKAGRIWILVPLTLLIVPAAVERSCLGLR